MFYLLPNEVFYKSFCVYTVKKFFNVKLCLFTELQVDLKQSYLPEHTSYFKEKIQTVKLCMGMLISICTISFFFLINNISTA